MKLYSASMWAASLALATVVTLRSPAWAADPAPDANTSAKPNPTDRPSGGPSSEGARARQNAAMAELGLSDEQRDKLRAAQKEQGEKARAIRGDASLSRDQKAEKVRDLRAAFTASAKTILTAEQFEKWQKMQEARRQRSGQPKSGQPAPAQ